MEKNQRASKSSPDLSRTVRIKVQDAKHRNEQTPQARVEHACHSDSSSRTAVCKSKNPVKKWKPCMNQQL
jgi:hypothetical protein